MSRLNTSLALLVPGLIALVGFARQDSAPPQDADEPQELARSDEKLAAMDWLAGYWLGEMWGGMFHAHYSTPEGGLILSHSRLITDGEETFYEFEVFGPADDEVVWLQPFPGGRKAVGFRLKELDVEARMATFENPDKDFPTRIVYHRQADDRLVITLSDPHGESEQVETFDLRRP